MSSDCVPRVGKAVDDPWNPENLGGYPHRWDKAADDEIWTPGDDLVHYGPDKATRGSAVRDEFRALVICCHDPGDDPFIKMQWEAMSFETGSDNLRCVVMAAARVSQPDGDLPLSFTASSTQSAAQSDSTSRLACIECRQEARDPEGRSNSPRHHR